MKHWYRHLVILFCIAFLIAGSHRAQGDDTKKSFVFHGKVTSVADDGLMVNGEKVDGWMDAMTMKYKVDDPKVLKKIKAGDRIKATVYEGDISLHQVQVETKSEK